MQHLKAIAVARIVTGTLGAFVTVGTCRISDIKNDDYYENGASKASKGPLGNLKPYNPFKAPTESYVTPILTFALLGMKERILIVIPI